MNPLHRWSGLLVPIVCVPTTLAIGLPHIDSLSDSAVPRSGRFHITGSAFGSARGNGRVEIGGVPTPLTRWSDTRITAYVLGDAPLGPTTVRVVTDAGDVSNEVAMQIDPREPAGGRVRWRFRADSSFILHRPAIGADGTVYVNDVGGFLYALDAGGGLRWIFDTRGLGAEGPVCVAADGTVCVSSNPAGPELTIYALNPDGTQRWVFTDPDAQETVAGPSIGPDGNLYAVHDLGLGALSLSPGGQLRWNQPGFTDFGQSGMEIVFGPPGQLYFCARGSFAAFRLDGNQRWVIPVGSSSEQVAVGPDGSVYVEVHVTGAGIRLRSFDPGGALRWTFFGAGTNMISAPDVGPDGVIYIVRNGFELHAINPDGTQRWLHPDGNFFGPVTAGSSPYSGPVVSPDNSKVLIGGVTTIGGPGLIKAFSVADGSGLWTVPLPLENGGRVVPASRPKFAPNGRTAYIGTSIPGQNPADEYCYLYALDTTDGGAIPGDIDGDGDVDLTDLSQLLDAFGTCDGDAGFEPAADFDGSGCVDLVDLSMLLNNFGV